MTRSRAAVFGLLVVATFAAFFVAQRLKRAPPLVRTVMATPLVSPNSDGRFDAARLSFLPTRSDDMTVRVVDEDGDAVRTLVEDQPVRRYRRQRLKWDGRTDAGRVAPDGRYHYLVSLRSAGRAVILPRVVRLDVTPPRPRVLDIGPGGGSPAILPLPDGGPVTIRFSKPLTRRPTEVLIYRTNPAPGLVTQLETVPGGATATWDGTKGGRPVREGTYVVALRARDRAGNIGTTPRRLPPRPPYGTTLPGKGGITVRYLGAQPPLEPTVAGTRALFGVDARREPYRWSLRRVGNDEIRKEGRKTKPALRLAAPNGESGLYLLNARTARHETTVPFIVQAERRHPVLVVLPAITWQGTNAVDDDGDGWPNTLTHGLPVRRDRVLKDGLPEDLARRVAPLLLFLDRSGLRYDLTTDLALAAGNGPPIEGHKGVLLAGDERWLPARQQVALRRFVREGGTVATFGVDSLRRQVTVTPHEIRDPTPAAPTDAFGATLRPLVRAPDTTITVFDDTIDLFAGDVVGGTGLFTGYDAYEETASVGAGARVVASATTEDGKKVIVAERLGKGLVIRMGLPELPSRLGTPGNETELVRRTWTLLSR